MKRNSEYIGVDEKYIPENEKYVNDSILGSREEGKRKVKKFLKIGLGAWMILALVAIAFFVIVAMSIINHSRNVNNQIFDMFGGVVNQTKDLYNNDLNQMQSQFESSVNKVEQEFNSSLNKTESGKNVTMQDAQNQIDKMQSTMDSMMNQFMNY